jgi:hypothetical protein
VRFSRRATGASRIAVLALLSCLSFTAFAGVPGLCQKPGQEPKSFPLLGWDGGSTCRGKGRLQDKEYCRSKIVDRIVAQGKNAVPVLISQLTDARELKEPIFDFWNRMTVGDVANAVLESLFTDSDWKTFNMPGLESIRPKCAGSAAACWQMVLKRHGRKFVQDQWLAAWNKNKDRVYWDAKARCFRLSP